MDDLKIGYSVLIFNVKIKRMMAVMIRRNIAMMKKAITMKMMNTMIMTITMMMMNMMITRMMMANDHQTGRSQQCAHMSCLSEPSLPHWH